MPKILAIDDSKTMRLAIKITFQAEDSEVVAVSKGSEAVARAVKQGSDVILVDAVLADGEPSGYDVCRTLKADSSTSHIPVLMMVSNQTGIDSAAIEACGADGAITKPFDTSDLIQKVENLASGTGKPKAAASPKAAVPKAAAAPPKAAAAPPKAAARPRVSPAAPAPVSTSRPSASKPAPVAAAPVSSGKIPIVMPIPFSPAHAPTAGILKRLGEGGAIEGIDSKTAAALISLSREVIEQVVWEVVPDLAERIIRERQAN